jgi:hypothetical protein
VKDLYKTDLESYSKNVLGGPVVRKIVSNWAAKLEEPYFGITCDGKLKENLFELADEGAPVDQMVCQENYWQRKVKKPDFSNCFL